jgi:hypothetical protein
VLGFRGPEELIHRDDLVLMQAEPEPLENLNLTAAPP